jgi:His-Xaa-Ser system protein HxsD
VSCAAEGFCSELDSELSATIYLDVRIYSKEAVLKASYWYTDLAYISFPESPESKLAVHIKLKQAVPTLDNPKPGSIEEVVDEFCNSVLDFELRRQVEVETAAVRQLILAKAFSDSGVLEDEPPGSIADPVEIRKECIDAPSTIDPDFDTQILNIRV